MPGCCLPATLQDRPVAARRLPLSPLGGENIARPASRGTAAGQGRAPVNRSMGARGLLEEGRHVVAQADGGRHAVVAVAVGLAWRPRLPGLSLLPRLALLGGLPVGARATVARGTIVARRAILAGLARLRRPGFALRAGPALGTLPALARLRPCVAGTVALPARLTLGLAAVAR